MADFPTIARMPGGYSDPNAADFEPGVVKGLRTAGLMLLVFAGLQIAVWVLGAAPSIAVIIDVFLGVQLLRLRHSWKLWALVRAWAGLAFAVLSLVAVELSVPTGLGVGAQVAYSGSLILLLTGVPSERAVLRGRVGFVLATILFVAFVLWTVLQRAAASATG